MEEPIKKILPVGIESEMKKSFISYAMAVIINRALPDVRDGLKPVHRRILYSMGELGVTPDKPYRKCARIVGDVLGKYHPHGDSSVYDALARLAQDFSIRHMLVDGHGNFGSVDGDSPAAMRYTEARLSKIATEMLRDLEKNTVDFYPNFDETLMQPTVLPSRYPNLLVNGSGGIAVGMATNIPPHNLGETIDAAIAMIDDPDISSEQLMEYIPGPDFPTGGIIMGTSGIRQAYTTGRGRIVVRAKTEIEEYDNGHNRIVVSEIPYQVNKAALIERIAELVHDKKLDGIRDIRDESDKEGMRIVIEMKRDGDPNVVLNRLYKHTQMQDTFGVISIALVDGTPKVLSLRQMLHHYLDHQKEIIVRRTKYDLEKAKARAHILEGLLIALDNIDEVIRIIRGSDDDASAKAALTARFGLTEKQTQAILDMRLKRLTGLERDKIEAEYAELMERIAYYEKVLSTPQMVLDIIREEMLEIKGKYSNPRRTEISPTEDEIDMAELITEEDMVVTLTHLGYLKRTSAATYRTQRRGGRGVTGLATKEEDFAEHVFVCSTHAQILYFTNKGKVYRKVCYEIPEAGRNAKGLAIVNVLQLDPGEKVTAMLPYKGTSDDGYLMFATKQGFVKRTRISAYANIRQNGLLAVGLREDDELIAAFRVEDGDSMIVGTRNGMSIRFAIEDAREMGRLAMGVIAIALREGDCVVGAGLVRPGCDILIITENGYGKRTEQNEYKIQRRGGTGIKTVHITEKTGLTVALDVTDGTEDIMIINDAGVIIRLSVSEISKYGRDTQGVRLMKVGDDVRVASVALMPEGDDDEETEAGGEEETPAQE